MNPSPEGESPNTVWLPWGGKVWMTWGGEPVPEEAAYVLHAEHPWPEGFPFPVRVLVRYSMWVSSLAHRVSRPWVRRRLREFGGPWTDAEGVWTFEGRHRED